MDFWWVRVCRREPSRLFHSFRVFWWIFFLSDVAGSPILVFMVVRAGAIKGEKLSYSEETRFLSLPCSWKIFFWPSLKQSNRKNWFFFDNF